MIAANDTNLCGAILVLFLEFRPGRGRGDISHMDRRQNSARLPGSYEEVLNGFAHNEFLQLS